MRTLAFGDAEEFSCGSGRLDEGLEPISLGWRGVVANARVGQIDRVEREKSVVMGRVERRRGGMLGYTGYF